jgi:hypothetical protein
LEYPLVGEIASSFSFRFLSGIPFPLDELTSIKGILKQASGNAALCDSTFAMTIMTPQL